MTSGGGTENPNFGYLKKQYFAKCIVFKGGNFKFMYCFLSTPGDFGYTKYHY